ncbi:hypothetical protein G6F63_015194 [Rhizopus arrhizus]|nr:hypothetical protein G6F63_015194 [Rhizopus arrhizus]
MKSCWLPSAAASRKAFQSMPGAVALKSAWVQGLAPLVTSLVSSWVACACAILVSSARMRCALPAGSAAPASCSICAM